MALALGRWMHHSHVPPEVVDDVARAWAAYRNGAADRLDLSGRSLPPGDPLPDLSGVVPAIGSIDLTNTRLREVPRSLLCLTGLTELALGENPIAELPEEIGTLVGLRDLDLRGTYITGLPGSICQSGVATLVVSDCRLTALPREMGQMRNLRELWIGGNPDLAEVPESLADLHPDCEIHVNREQPFHPHDLLRPAHEVFAYDPEDAPGETPPLDAAVAAWRQDSSPRGELDPWTGFAGEDNATSFADWLHAMHGTVSGGSAEVAAGMRRLLRRMEDRPEFRRECFRLAADAMGHCDDRVALGVSRMQAALLISCAGGGELAPALLVDASLKVFNQKALEGFAKAHAAAAGIPDEELEVVLALETRLSGRLALPGGVAGMRNTDFVRGPGKVDNDVVQQALAHVQGLWQDPGADGLKAFLAGQCSFEFMAWAEYLRREHPDDFDTLYRNAQAAHAEAARALGGTPEANEQAGVESKAFYQREFADLVWRLTQAWLPAVGIAGAQPEGAGRSSIAADRVAAFQEAATAARPRQRLQRGDERPRDESPRSPR